MLNHELVRLSLVTVIGVTVLLFRPSVRFAKATSPFWHQYVAKGSDIEPWTDTWKGAI